MPKRQHTDGVSEKERAFCHAVVEKRLSILQAAKEVGYIPNGNDASRMRYAVRVAAKPQVVAYMEQLQAGLRERTLETAERHVQELNEALTMARANNCPADMIKAVMAKAKITGTLVEQHEHRGRIEHAHEHRHESVSDTAAWLDELVGRGADREVPQPRPH